MLRFNTGGERMNKIKQLNENGFNDDDIIDLEIELLERLK